MNLLSRLCYVIFLFLVPETNDVACLRNGHCPHVQVSVLNRGQYIEHSSSTYHHMIITSHYIPIETIARGFP